MYAVQAVMNRRAPAEVGNAGSLAGNPHVAPTPRRLEPIPADETEIAPGPATDHSAKTSHKSPSAAVMNPPPVAAPRGFRVAGITEPSPDRYARVPLATSQAVAFIDVKVGEKVKKGYQLFSHWESPDRLQAFKIDVQKTKKLLELAETRLKSAEQNLARVEKLQDTASAQEKEDAETAASIRRQELEAAKLAVAEAERRFAATDFEFKQAFVTSPIDGVVAAIDLTPGERRQVGNAFRGVTVLDASVLHCRTLMSNEQIDTLNRWQSAQSTAADAGPYVEHAGKRIPLKVVSIGLIADPATGLVPVTFEIQNPDVSLRVGVRLDVVIDELPTS
jgi:multidrug efflux pump subunit AcrA (membrane-fusion protein)